MLESVLQDFDAQCGDGVFFLQAPCIVPREHFLDRLMFALFAGCLAVFIFFVSQLYFDYIKTRQKMEYIEYDIRTITAADYSVEFKISREQV